MAGGKVGSVGFVVASVVLAGCLAGLPEETRTASAAALPRVVAPAAPAHVEGGELAAERSGWTWTPLCILTCERPPAPECGEDNCARVPFRLDLPEGFWDDHEGGLEVSVLWPFDTDDDWSWIQARILDSAGNVVAEGSGGIGTVAILDAAAPGEYVAEALAWSGSTTFEMHVEVEARPKGPARDLLPDLVVLPPTDLRIEAPWGEGPDDRVLAAAGVEGCSAYEATEAGAKRCLRFSNRVGNAGEGPLEVRLSVPEGAKALAGSGRHHQRIHASDGSHRDVDVGPATFHPTHTHFHYEGLNAFEVYEHDLATGTRGALVNTGHKGGVCLVNSGLIALGMPNTELPNYEATCFYPLFTPLFVVWSGQAQKEWSMVLSANWYDLYGWGLDDMYVDMTGAPDGVYELVSLTNVDGSVHELDRTNNEASVVFRLTGDQVEILSPA